MNLKKFMFGFLILLFSLNIVSAGSLITEQTQANSLLALSDGSNIYQKVIFPTDNNNETINNISITSDFSESFLLTDNLYFTYDKGTGNATNLTIYTEWGTGTTPELKTYVITMSTPGTYTYVFQPDYAGELLQLRINYPDSDAPFIENFHVTRQEGIITPIQTFISYTADLVELNLQFWRLMFYLTILIIFLSFIGVMFWGVFQLIEYGDKIREKKHRIFRRR